MRTKITNCLCHLLFHGKIARDVHTLSSVDRSYRAMNLSEVHDETKCVWGYVALRNARGSSLSCYVAQEMGMNEKSVYILTTQQAPDNNHDDL